MLISFSPLRIYLFRDKLLFILRSHLERALPRSPDPPGEAIVVAWVIKMDPCQIPLWVPMGTTTNNQETNRSPNKQTRSFPFPEETLVWQRKEEVHGGKGLRRGGGRRGCNHLPSWKLVYSRSASMPWVAGKESSRDSQGSCENAYPSGRFTRSIDSQGGLLWST